MYDSLFTPITLRGRTFRNRVFSSAHAPGYAEGGQPGERYQAYHEEKAKGGIGLTIFGGSSNVSRDSGSIYGQIYLGNDTIVPIFRSFAQRIHRHGAGLMCQISHMGRRTSWDSGDWLPTKGPSAGRDPAHHSAPYELSTREIARIVRAFAQAAERCREGGLDGIEVLTTTHLLGQFLSPISNQRRDQYGGSVENRMRFMLEVLEACRERVGEEFIIGVRIAPDESNEDGLVLSEGLVACDQLAEQGVADYLNVNGAYAGTDMGLSETYPGMAFKSAPYIELARRVKERSGLPVFQSARITDLTTADWAVEKGYVDMAGLVRPHFADPHLVAKTARGEERRVRPCVGAGYCLDRAYAGREAFCVHNVSTGRELILPHLVPRASNFLEAVVVGAGPAGLEAARVLALRGHTVTLFEAGQRPGGQVLLAAKAAWRKDMIGIADWLADEVVRLGVLLHLNRYVESNDINAVLADVVIIATGGVPDVSLARGGEHLVKTAWDVLAGQERVEGDVLIYDEVGGHCALSLAHELSSQHHSMVFVTPDREVGRALGGQNYPLYLRNLARAKTELISSQQLLGVHQEGNRLVCTLRHAFSRDTTEVIADTVIVDKGTQPMNGIFADLVPASTNLGELDYDALVECRAQPSALNNAGTYQLYRVGDAWAGRDIHAAMLDSNRLCRAL